MYANSAGQFFKVGSDVDRAGTIWWRYASVQFLVPLGSPVGGRLRRPLQSRQRKSYCESWRHVFRWRCCFRRRY